MGETVDEQGFITAMGVAIASDTTDVLLPKVLVKILPIPRLLPIIYPHEVVDAITRAIIEATQGKSVLRELSTPIEHVLPIAPVHTISVLFGEAEKRIIGPGGIF